jgi:hypothetical protein
MAVRVTTQEHEEDIAPTEAGAGRPEAPSDLG